MQPRYLSPAIRDLCFADHKMAFLSGPRQCRKTMLAKLLLGEFDKGSYFVWDDPEFRRISAKSPRQLLPSTTPALVVFDEIHKAKNWHSTLKRIFDTRPSPVNVLVTGSARLNLLRHSGDSLVGGYYPFHLHPFSLAELLGSAAPEPANFLRRITTPHPAGRSKAAVETLEALMTYGGFPKPFLHHRLTRRAWPKIGRHHSQLAFGRVSPSSSRPDGRLPRFWIPDRL
jgi:predicted AAA+ superfamily ATPase